MTEHWLRKLTQAFGGKSRASRRPKDLKSQRSVSGLRVELLEDRCVPSTNPVLTAAGPQHAKEGMPSILNLGTFSDTFGGPWNVDVNWGDGTADTQFQVNHPGTIPTQQHVYADNGQYTATVTVTDLGQPNNTPATGNVTVNVANVPPLVTLGNLPANNASPEGAPIALTSSVTDPGPIDNAGPFTYSWTVTKVDSQGNVSTFATGSDAAPTFTPDDSGMYIVTLHATDKDGGTGAATQIINVTSVAPSVTITGDPASGSATVPTSVNEGDTVALASTVAGPGSGDVLTYAWTVTKTAADGTVTQDYAVGDQPNFSFVPDGSGSYDVSLTVTNDAGVSGTASATIAASNVAPGVSITDAPTSHVNEGDTVTLSSDVTDPGAANTFTYAWTVTKTAPDGTVTQDFATSDQPDFSFTPDDSGTYAVSLTVTDSSGGVGTAQATIIADNVPPTPAITGTPSDHVSEGDTVTLGSNVTDAGTADTFTYAWTVTKTAADGTVTPNFATGTDANFTFTPDDNGTYDVSLTVTDDGGGVGTTQTTVIADNVPPTPSITGAPSGHVNEGDSVTLGSSVTDPGTADTFTYAWTVTKTAPDGTVTPNFATGDQPNFTFTPDDSGTYAVNLTVTDDDGGVGTTQTTVIADNVPPTPTITGMPSDHVNEGDTVILGSSVTDPGTADTFTYAWSVTKTAADGTVTQDFATGTDANFSFTPDDNGTYTVNLTVTDDGGGVGTTQTTVIADNVPPTPSITGAPSGHVNEGDNVTLGGSVTDPGLADTFTYVWTVTKTAPDGTVTQNFATGDQPNFTFTPDDAGTYDVSLTVTDDDGGVGTTRSTVIADNVPPVPTITDAPTDHVNEGDTVTLGSSVSDPGTADTFTYAWSVTKTAADGTVTQNFATGTDANFSFTPDDNGTYAVNLTVTDDNGGVGTTQTTVIADNVPPTPSITGVPSGHVNEGDSVTLGSSVTDAGTADTFTYAWTVTKTAPDGTVTQNFATSDQANFTFTPDDGGTYVVNLTVTDDDGGVGTTQTTVIADNVPPTPTITGMPSDHVNEGDTVTLGSTVTDPGTADTFTYAWSVTKTAADGTVTQNFATGTDANFSFTPDDNGTYTVNLAVTDDGGAVGTTQTTVIADNVPPTPTITGAPSSSVNEGDTVSLTGSATDAGTADTITYAWTVDKTTSDGTVIHNFATGDGTSFSFQPDDAGTYTVTLTATDDDGGVGTTQTTVTAANVAPTVAITNIPTTSVTAGTPVTLGSDVTDPGSGDTFAYSWTVTKTDAQGNTTTFATSDEASLTFTPDTAGTYDVSLTVTDNNGGSDTALASITATNVRPEPTITGAPSSSPEGTAINLGSTVADAGPDPLTYNWSVTKDGNPFGTVGSDATYSFTPDDNGTYVVTLIVTNGNGDSGTTTSTITGTNVAPTVSITGPAKGVPGQALSFSGIFHDVGSADLPSETFLWKLIDNSNGHVVQTGNQQNFSVTVDTPGNYTVSFRVTDKDGGTMNVGKNLSITSAALVTDPLNSSRTALMVGGTPGDDTIVVQPADASGNYSVTLNGTNIGSFKPTGHIVVFGGAGNDSIQLVGNSFGTVTVPAQVFGQDGDDTIDSRGSTANNVLVGGTGNDTILDNPGKNILIGGAGLDSLNQDKLGVLKSNLGDDLLIGDSTAFDANILALNSLMAEWSRSDLTPQQKADHLAGRTPGGLNGGTLLTVGPSGTVTDDGQVDSVFSDPLRANWQVDITNGHNP